MILLLPPLCFLVLLWLYMGHAATQIALNADRLSPFAKWLGYYPVTLVGFLWDVYVNIIWCSLVFLDQPQEWTLTRRVERLQHAQGYRGKLARWLKSELNNLLPGHCK